MEKKALAICHHESDQTNVVTSPMVSRTSSSSTYSFFSAMRDYIGTESCLNVASSNDVVPPPCRKKEAKSAAREIPQLISGLAWTKNHRSHMGWVLKRDYTSDGRLILRLEKNRHHEYFRAHRSNGRLTLELVPLDDVFLNYHDDDHHHDHDDDDHHHGHDVAHEDDKCEEGVLDSNEGDGKKGDDDDDMGGADDGDDRRGILLSPVTDQKAVEDGGGGERRRRIAGRNVSEGLLSWHASNEDQTSS